MFSTNKLTPKLRDLSIVTGLTLVTALTFGLFGVFISKAVWNSYTEDVLRESHVIASRFKDKLSSSLNQGNDPKSVINDFQELLEQLPYGEENFVCLVDQDYQVVSHPNNKMVGSAMAIHDFEPFNSSSPKDKNSEVRGAKYLYNSADFEGDHMVYQLSEDSLPWKVSIHSNLEEHRARVQNIQKSIAFFALPMLLLIPWAGTAVVRRITHRYESQLEKANAQLEDRVEERTLQLQESNTELEKAKLAAEFSDRLKSEFLTVMSHEYRTPLNGILGLSQVLKSDLEKEDVIEIATDIEASGTRLNVLLERILYFTDVEAQTKQPELEELRLSSLIEDLSSLYKPTADSKKISFSILNYSKTESLMSNSEMLQTALRELLDNAFKFTNEGHVHVHISEENQCLNFDIIDSGLGIPSSAKNRLFKLFTQGNGDLNRAHEGVGLGLIMAKKISEILGGTLDYHSVENVGTTFTLSVPCIQAQV